MGCEAVAASILRTICEFISVLVRLPESTNGKSAGRPEESTISREFRSTGHSRSWKAARNPSGDAGFDERAGIQRREDGALPAPQVLAELALHRNERYRTHKRRANDKEYWRSDLCC